MDFNKFTQKSLEAIQNAQSVALENGHSEIVQEHSIWCFLLVKDWF